MAFVRILRSEVGLRFALPRQCDKPIAPNDESRSHSAGRGTPIPGAAGIQSHPPMFHGPS